LKSWCRLSRIDDGCQIVARLMQDWGPSSQTEQDWCWMENYCSWCQIESYSYSDAILSPIEPDWDINSIVVWHGMKKLRPMLTCLTDKPWTHRQISVDIHKNLKHCWLITDTVSAHHRHCSSITDTIRPSQTLFPKLQFRTP
jgi:hypothetical protein